MNIHDEDFVERLKRGEYDLPPEEVTKGDKGRYVTRTSETARSDYPTIGASWEDLTGRGDPDQRYQIRRLCPCEACEGTGKKREVAVLGGLLREVQIGERCPDCRGEGKTLELVATAGSPEAIGVAIVQLGREAEFDDCPVGLLDTMAEPSEKKWLILPWLPSPRNATDAGRLLQRRRRIKK